MDPTGLSSKGSKYTGVVEVIIVCERHNFNLGKGGEGVLYGRERGAR